MPSLEDILNNSWIHWHWEIFFFDRAIAPLRLFLFTFDFHSNWSISIQFSALWKPFFTLYVEYSSMFVRQTTKHATFRMHICKAANPIYSKIACDDVDMCVVCFFFSFLLFISLCGKQQDHESLSMTWPHCSFLFPVFKRESKK